MLSPCCASCGCALDARPGGVTGEPGSAAFSLPPRVAAALRLAGLAAGALALYTAASLGFHAAGPAGGMTAFGAGGFLVLPFVPERVGTGSGS